RPGIRQRPREPLPGADGRRAAARLGGDVPGDHRGAERRRWRQVRLFLSGLRKLIRRPASVVTVGLLLGLLVLIILATAPVSQRSGGTEARRALLIVTFPGAYEIILSFIFGLGGLFAVTYGAAIAGSEWSWGTLKNAVARGESRARYQLLTFAAIAVMVAI